MAALKEKRLEIEDKLLWRIHSCYYITKNSYEANLEVLIVMLPTKVCDLFATITTGTILE